jgi:hypothetical protein
MASLKDIPVEKSIFTTFNAEGTETGCPCRGSGLAVSWDTDIWDTGAESCETWFTLNF